MAEGSDEEDVPKFEKDERLWPLKQLSINIDGFKRVSPK